MVFDAARGYVLLFGGQTHRGVMLGDTWTHSGGRWRSRWSWGWSQPQPRCGHSLAYDEDARCAVLFGGIAGGDRTLGDTWTFNGASWRSVPGPQPPARRYAAFAYDPELQGCVLHGGSVDDAGNDQFGDAWLFRDRHWSPLHDGFETDVRDDHGLAYHYAADTLVMLEGVGGERGILVRGTGGWEAADCDPLHPRHQCSQLAWDEDLAGLVMHGGEVCHRGAQFDATLVLRLAPERDG
jgi:hypothetical protein